MYSDEENRVEKRTEEVREEKAEEVQASDENKAQNQPQAASQENYVSNPAAGENYAGNSAAKDNYADSSAAKDNYSSAAQSSAYASQQQGIYGNSQSNAYGNSQQSSYGQQASNMYGSSQPGGYGNSQPGGYGSGQPGNYGNYPSGNYGNSQPGNYGGSQPGSTGYHQAGNNGYHPQGSTGYQTSGNTSYQQGQNSNYGRQYAPWQQPQDAFAGNGKKTRAKKPVPPLAKKTAGIVAAALLFGVVAGTTMSGVQMLSRHLNPSAEQESVTVSQAETVPAPQTSKQENRPVVVTGTNDVSAIVERAMPSVVAINSVTQREIQNWFGQSQIYEGRGSGSGIIVGESESELLLVTNNHVIEGATSLSVNFCDNETAEAHIKGTDSENDLAVLAVSLDAISDDTKSKIAIATLGDSDSLKVGQGVIAIGNALGYGQSVTVGYISALDREVHTDEQTTRNLLQTDAAINPGNSGGALLNMQGELVGINSAKYSSTDVEGMGYAIPISKVSSIIDELMTKKTRVQIEEERQGYLGIQGTDIDAKTANLYGMPQGVFVYKIVEGGAAAASDLKEKDIITKFDGQTVRTMAELKDMLIYYAGGDSVELTVQSLSDGAYVERQVTITLGTRPKEENVN